MKAWLLMMRGLLFVRSSWLVPSHHGQVQSRPHAPCPSGSCPPFCREVPLAEGSGGGSCHMSACHDSKGVFCVEFSCCKQLNKRTETTVYSDKESLDFPFGKAALPHSLLDSASRCITGREQAPS